MANEWYFKEGAESMGPVSPAALKQLAESGRITPETLIWKDGLPHWAPAKSVRGLFPASAAEPRPQVAAPLVATPPVPQQTVHGGWHPFDLVVSASRSACPPSLPAAISRIAGAVGVYAVYVAAAITLLVGVIVAIRTNQFSALGLFAALSFAMLVIQYTAQRLLSASDSAVRSNTSFLSSYAVPDCVFVLTVFGTLGGAVWLLWQSVSEGSLNLAIAAVVTLAVGAFISMVSLHPPEIRVLEKPECQASEDAIGFLTFIVKLFLRCAPIMFAAAIVYGTYRLGSAAIGILRADKEVAGFASLSAFATAGLVLAATAIPFYAYLLTILYYLSLDVLSAIVSIPEKLDAIANGRGNGGEG